MNKENKLTFIDEQGNEVLCEVLFTFSSEEFNKNYVLFYPVGSEDEDGSINVMAASYKETEDGAGDLEEITSDEEWNLIEEMLASFAEDECEECEDCDEGECEEGHCCCHSEEK